ncbi:MAG: hypothetical protein RMM58_10010 [Chloroflexota bacterium]|nr:hypothetical protein [Dehalococcoidia bacterium]MDW8254201.1 hypothetical protein [Chloroflexota bacterium]
MLLLRRFPPAVKAVWLLSALTALALVLPLWPGADLRLPWISGTPDVALALTLHVDALTRTFALAVAIIALGVALSDTITSPPWRFVVGRHLAFGIALLIIAAADIAVAASAVLLLPLAEGVTRRFDDDARFALLGGMFGAGMGILAAASFGPASFFGFVALLAATLFLLFQLPFTSLAERALGGLPGAFSANLATVLLPGLAIVIRFGCDGAAAWQLQLLSVFGSSTMAWAGLAAAQAATIPQLLAALAPLYAGSSLLALGQGISPTQPAAILIGIASVLALAGTALTADRLAVSAGTTAFEGARGIAFTRPASALLLLGGALTLFPLPLLGGAPLGSALALAGAWSDGRVVLVILALAGLSGASVGLGRLAMMLFARPAERRPLPEQPVGLVAAALPLASAAATGVLAFTAWDPAAHAAIAVFGLRPRPTGGELLALPWYGTAAAIVSLSAATALGLALAARRHRLAPPPRPRPSMEVPAPPPASGTREVTEGTEQRPNARPLLDRAAQFVQFSLWLFAQGLAVLEGRYYMAAVLVISLWALIIFLG